VPSPIFAAAVMGVERLLRLELDASLPAATYMRQALKQVPEHVLAFGRSVGVVVNYRPDFAVKYDLGVCRSKLSTRRFRAGRRISQPCTDRLACQGECLRQSSETITG
jgi:hypothetical protein